MQLETMNKTLSQIKIHKTLKYIIFSLFENHKKHLFNASFILNIK